MDKAIADGRTAIGYNCYVVPEALINAGNVFPIWLRAPGVESTSEADYYLSNVICSYAKSLLQAGLEGAYDFLGALVFAPSCDHIRRGAQHLDLQKAVGNNEKFFTFAIDAANKVAPYELKWYISGTKRLVEKLNETYDANINEETLRKSIKEINEFNVLMQSIGDFRKGPNPKITGTEFHKIYGATKVVPKDLIMEPLRKIKAELEAREPDKTDAIRLMLVGPTFDDPKFTELIEAQGAIVVADRYCFGSLPGMEPIKEDGDPYENIANYYMETCQCSRMMEKAPERADYSKKLVKEYDVDGIVLQYIKFCDLWGYEALTYVDRMKDANVPVVKIEREYALSGEGQLRTRIQAFLESVKSKRELEVLNK